MRQEANKAPSPFSALTYQEQQDRWLEWRSRQLDYQEAAPPSETPAPRDTDFLTPPPLRQTAPTRHRELDQVLSRHAQALKRAGAFRSASPTGAAGQ